MTSIPLKDWISKAARSSNTLQCRYGIKDAKVPQKYYLLLINGEDIYRVSDFHFTG